MAFKLSSRRSVVSQRLLALCGLALLLGCGSKEAAPTMTLQEARYILANEAARLQPLEVTRDAIQADLDKHDNPRRGERPPTATRAELEQSRIKIEAEIVELSKRVEMAKEVVAKSEAEAKAKAK